MRTVLLSALTALATAALVVLLLPPPSAPPEVQGPNPEVLRRIDALEQALAALETPAPVRLEGSSQASALRIQDLEARLAQVEEAAETRTAAPVGAAEARLLEAEAAAAKARLAADEECKKWINRLYDANENIAFSAALELGRLEDLDSVPPLRYVMRTHRDFYVRLGCATALGDIRALSAVPDLIDALNDKDQLVRTAANDALQSITSGKVSYEAAASERDRLDAQNAWRDWFKENEPRLRSAGQK